ncbi:MAG: hypothetical protein U0103_03450 [Candidatus Obscuribacterales bacterium]
MSASNLAKEMIDGAEAAYANGELTFAEEQLLNALKLYDLSVVDKESILVRLAGLACQQGQYLCGAHYYLLDLQSKSQRYDCEDPVMKQASRNYRKLLELSLPNPDEIENDSEEKTIYCS